MFADAPDGKTLRQGDILERIPFPLLASSSLRVLGAIDVEGTDKPYPKIEAALIQHRDNPNYFTAQVPMSLSFAAVVSHCCELEPRNGKLMGATFSVARLIAIKPGILRDAEKLTSLKANKDPRTREPSYLDFFYIEPHDSLNAKEWMVDFSQLISIPNSEFPTIVRQKLLQMDDRTRVKFKIKFAFYLGRLTDEEVADGITDPWAEPRLESARRKTKD